MTEDQLVVLAMGSGQDANLDEFDRVRTRVRAAIELVERFAGGPLASETFTHGWQLPCVLTVMRPIASITAITERRRLADAEVELEDTDYQQLDPWRLLRVGAGWGASVTVSYAPVIDQALRDQVILDLAQLAAHVGLRGESLGDGDWSVSYATDDQVGAILSRLTEGRTPIF